MLSNPQFHLLNSYQKLRKIAVTVFSIICWVIFTSSVAFYCDGTIVGGEMHVGYRELQNRLHGQLRASPYFRYSNRALHLEGENLNLQ